VRICSDSTWKTTLKQNISDISQDLINKCLNRGKIINQYLNKKNMKLMFILGN
jgi:hypothetical protein